MAQYIDEYLVALGFDLNSEQGKEYLKMLNDLDKKEQELAKTDKAASEQAKKTKDAQGAVITGNNKEIDSIKKLSAEKKKAQTVKPPLQSSKQQKAVSPVKAQEEISPPPSSPQTPNKRKVQKPKKKIPQPVKAQEAEATQEVQHKEKKAPFQTKTVVEPTKGHENLEENASYVKPEQQPTEPTTPQPAQPKATGRKGKKSPKAEKPQPEQTFPSIMGDLEGTLKNIGSTWAQIERGNFAGAIRQGSSAVMAFNNYVDNLSNSFNSTNSHAGRLKTTLHDMFSGTTSAATEAGAAAESAEGAGEAAAGAAGISGTAVAGATGGIAAGVALITKSVWDMSNGLANTNTNIETMSRQLWISNSAAWQLNNTLNAMGKTTADLNEIAINPILNKQYKTLQNFQKTYAKLPSDFKETNEAFVEQIQTPMEEAKLEFNNFGQNIKYNLEKIMLSMFGGGKTQNAASGLLNGTVGLALQPGPLQGLAQMALPSNTEKTNNAQSSATYAPQTYTSSITNEGSNITYSPNTHITVNADSNSANDISSAVEDAAVQAAQENFKNVATIKGVQGLNR